MNITKTSSNSWIGAARNITRLSQRCFNRPQPKNIIYLLSRVDVITDRRKQMNPKDLSNEELATILRALKVTGICPSRDEKEYLEEAADRLEKQDESDRSF